MKSGSDPDWRQQCCLDGSYPAFCDHSNQLWGKRDWANDFECRHAECLRPIYTALAKRSKIPCRRFLTLTLIASPSSDQTSRIVAGVMEDRYDIPEKDECVTSFRCNSRVIIPPLYLALLRLQHGFHGCSLSRISCCLSRRRGDIGTPDHERWHVRASRRSVRRSPRIASTSKVFPESSLNLRRLSFPFLL